MSTTTIDAAPAAQEPESRRSRRWIESYAGLAAMDCYGYGAGYDYYALAAASREDDGTRPAAETTPRSRSLIARLLRR